MPRGDSDNGDAAFFGVDHIACRIGDERQIRSGGVGWLISLAVRGRAVAVDEIGSVSEKPSDHGSLVRLHISAEDMRKAVRDAGLRQETSDSRGRIRRNDGERAVPRQGPHNIDHSGDESGHVIGVQLREEVAGDLRGLSLVLAYLPKTGEEVSSSSWKYCS